MRKAQVTVFIILGILILALGALSYFLNAEQRVSTETTAKPTVIEDISGVKQFVQACVESTAQDSVIALGVVGGKSELFQYYSPDPADVQYKIPYFYFATDDPLDATSPSPATASIPPFNTESIHAENRRFRNTQPNNVFFENILNKYIQARLQVCTKDITTLAKGFTINNADIIAVPNVESTIGKNNVQFLVKYPIRVERAGITSVINDYSYAHPVRLLDILNIARDTVQLAFEHEDIIYWDYMTDVTRNNYNYTAYAERDHTIVYRLVDLENKVHFEPYVFQFAVRVRVE